MLRAPLSSERRFQGRLWDRPPRHSIHGLTLLFCFLSPGCDIRTITRWFRLNAPDSSTKWNRCCFSQNIIPARQRRIPSLCSRSGGSNLFHSSTVVAVLPTAVTSKITNSAFVLGRRRSMSKGFGVYLSREKKQTGHPDEESFAQEHGHSFETGPNVGALWIGRL